MRETKNATVANWATDFRCKFSLKMLMIAVVLIGYIFALTAKRYRESVAERANLRTLAEAFPYAHIDIWYHSQKENNGGYSRFPKTPTGGVFAWLFGDVLVFERVSKISISCPPNITLFGGRTSTSGFYEPTDPNQDYSTLPSLCNCKYLEEIDIAIVNLKSLEGLGELKSLRKITLFECFAIKNVDELAGLANLSELEIHGCHSLKNLDGISGLEQLVKVEIFRCDSLPDKTRKTDRRKGDEEKR